MSKAPVYTPSKQETSLFWGQIYYSGLAPMQVFAALGVANMNEWLASGHTLEQARQLVFRELGLNPL